MASTHLLALALVAAAVLVTLPPPSLTLAVPVPRPPTLSQLVTVPCNATEPPNPRDSKMRLNLLPNLPGERGLPSLRPAVPLHADSAAVTAVAVAAQLVARFQQRPDIRVANATLLAAKLETFVRGGGSKLAVIADWDRTVTKGSSLSSHSVVHSYNGPGALTRACTDRMHNTSAHYLKIEQDPALSIEEKLPFMVEWYRRNHEAFVDCKVTRGMLRAATAAALGNGALVLREGAAAAMETAAQAQVPFLVFSAGLADVIQTALLDGGVPLRTTIVSNQMTWSEGERGGRGDGNTSGNTNTDTNTNRSDSDSDSSSDSSSDSDSDGSSSSGSSDSSSDARLVGFSSPLIHMFNKDQSQVLLADQPGLQRPHVLVVGDGLGDATMSNGAAHPPSDVIRVGFLNYQDFDPHLADYLKAFDVVLLHDMSMEPVIDIIRAVTATPSSSSSSSSSTTSSFSSSSSSSSSSSTATTPSNPRGRPPTGI